MATRRWQDAVCANYELRACLHFQRRFVGRLKIVLGDVDDVDAI